MAASKGRAPPSASEPDDMEEAVVEAIILHRHNTELEHSIDAEDMVFKYWTERQAMSSEEAMQRIRSMQAKAARYESASDAIPSAHEPPSPPQTSSAASSPLSSTVSARTQRASRRQASASSATRSPAAHPSPVRQGTPKRRRQNASDALPARGSAANPRATYDALEDWEPFVDEIARVERDASSTLYVHLAFKDGARLVYPTSVVRRRCPQALLAFYERHAAFPLP
ncbi:hypothetical protein CBS9595_003665 [Malassezia furfur]|nr:hypothetical protein CBS9595_003665 [Malassezia furfur]